MKTWGIVGIMLFFSVCLTDDSLAEPSHVPPEVSATSSTTNESEKEVFGFIRITPLQQLNLEEYEEFYGRTVDEIRLHGTRRTKDTTILRELRMKVGEPLLKEHLEHDYQSLDALNIFSDLRISPTEEDGRVIVNVEVKETIAFLPTVSVQYNDENGFSAGGGLKALNLLGRAIKFSGVALFGGTTTFAFLLADPWVTGNHLGYNLEVAKRERQNELFDFFEDGTEGYLTLSSYVKDHGRLGSRLSLVSIGSDVDGKTLSEDDRDDVAFLSLFLGYEHLDSPLTPQKGIWAEFEVGKSGLFGSDSDFWQGQFDLRGYLPLAERHRLELFSLTTLRDGAVGTEIAPWQQFGIGGSNTVRGWDLGAQIGKNQFLATAEYVYTLITPKTVTFFSRFSTFFALDVSVFGDLGSAWNRSEAFEESFIGGGGVGLRFILPYVGMARIELGIGEEDVGVLLHFRGLQSRFVNAVESVSAFTVICLCVRIDVWFFGR